MRYICTLCGYIYDEDIGDEDNGIEPETEFDSLPAEWVCPECGTPKDDFDIYDETAPLDGYEEDAFEMDDYSDNNREAE